MSVRLFLLSILAFLLLPNAPARAAAQDFQFPAAFVVRDIATNGTTIHVRSAGS